MLVKELFILAFWGQNVCPGWVKDGKKVVLITPILLPSQFFLKTEFLTAIASKNTNQAKG